MSPLPQEYLDAQKEFNAKYADEDDRDTVRQSVEHAQAAFLAANPNGRQVPEEPRVPWTKAEELNLAEIAHDNAPPGITYAAPSEKLVNAAAAEQTAAVQPISDMPGSPGADPNAGGVRPVPPMARDINVPSPQDLAANASASQLAKFGISGIDPHSTMLAQDAWQEASAKVRREEATLKDAQGDLDAAEKSHEAAAQLKLSTEMAKNKELEGTYKQREQIEKQNEIEVKQLYQTATQETTQQMMRVRQASDEAANAQIKNFWADKSTSGRIIGIISQALAGAANGLSGQPGAPTPLDRIIQTDLEKQRINLNNKNVGAQREEGILGTMQRQFSSNIAAHGAAYLASLSHVDALGKELAQKYATPEAMSVYQDMHATLQEKHAAASASLHGTLLSSSLQQQNTAGQIMERANAANAAVQAAAIKASGAAKGDHIMGLKHPVGKQAFTALQGSAQAAAVSINALEQLDQLIKNPDHLSPVRWKKKWENVVSNAFAGRRIDMHTGAKLDGGELALVEAGIPRLSLTLLGEIPSLDKIVQARGQVADIVDDTVRGYSARIRSVTGGDLDYDDPLIGGYLKRVAKMPEATP